MHFYSATSAVRGVVDTVGAAVGTARAVWNNPAGTVTNAAVPLRAVVDGVVDRAGQRLDAVTADTYRTTLRTELAGIVREQVAAAPADHPLHPFVRAAADTIAPVMARGSFADVHAVITGAYAFCFSEDWKAFGPAGLACFDAVQLAPAFAIVDRFGRLLTHDAGRTSLMAQRVIRGNVLLFMTLYPAFLAARRAYDEDEGMEIPRWQEFEDHLPQALYEAMLLCGAGQVAQGMERFDGWLQGHSPSRTVCADVSAPPWFPLFGCTAFSPFARRQGRTAPLFARAQTAWRAAILGAEVSYLWNRGERVRNHGYSMLAFEALYRSASVAAG